MYFVRTGFVDLMMDGAVVDTIQAGDYFGEVALLALPPTHELLQVGTPEKKNINENTMPLRHKLIEAHGYSKLFSGTKNLQPILKLFGCKLHPLTVTITFYCSRRYFHYCNTMCVTIGIA